MDWPVRWFVVVVLSAVVGRYIKLHLRRATSRPAAAGVITLALWPLVKKAREGGQR